VARARATSLNLFARGLFTNSMAGVPPTFKGWTAAEVYGNVEVSDSDSLLRNPEIPPIELSSQYESQEEGLYEAPQASEELPSKGSELHFSGKCEPCIFFKRKRCVAGSGCQYCHLSHHDELDVRSDRSSSKRETDGAGSTGEGSTTEASESSKSTSSKKNIVRL